MKGVITKEFATSYRGPAIRRQPAKPAASVQPAPAPAPAAKPAAAPDTPRAEEAKKAPAGRPSAKAGK